MLLKCYHHNLHPITKFEVGCAKQTFDGNFNLDIFEETINTNELVKFFVTKELLIFKHYQVNPKDTNCLFQWWGKYETMFPTICFLAYQILGIIGLQIGTKKISFL
jgi:hypothetical protein